VLLYSLTPRCWTSVIGPSGWRSVIYDEAENRLHAQKAVMALTM